MAFRLSLGVGILLLLVNASRAAANAMLLSGDAVSALTINLWHKDRPSELKVIASDLKRRHVPDFIFCQEVVFKRRGTEKDTAAVLARELGYYSRGTKRTTDKEGVAIVSRYPFAHYAERHLKSQTSRLLIGFRRVSIMGEFNVPRVGLVRVVNVHLTNWKFEGHIRRKQIAETLAWIAAREKQVPAAVTLLGGDFNAEVDWKEMKQMENPIGDGLVFRDFNSDKPTYGSPGNPHSRIDLIFVATKERPVHLVEERILWQEGLELKGDRFHVSDHTGVLHRYVLGRTGMGTDLAAVE